MTSQTLYLKYRPQTLDELDSEKVRTQLKALIASNRLPHAFLFSGPKGTGKTSTARILAKVINCEKNRQKLGEPCNKCDYCLGIIKGSNFDVIEMDAASNRGIDDIRSLKEKIILSPGSSRKKIYIIDEVHMLTTEAFNALLKTLEEPPEHVVFILATTDPHKLPDTVRSRLTNINFEKAKEGEIVRQLKRVAKEEKIEIDDKVLTSIAKVADGSFRDAIKTLEELLINTPTLKAAEVESYLHKNKLVTSRQLLELISQANQKAALELIEKFISDGGSSKNLIDTLMSDLHLLLLVKSHISVNELDLNFSLDQIGELAALLTEAKSQVAFAPITQLPLEIAVIKYLHIHGTEKVQLHYNSHVDSKKKESESLAPPGKKGESAPVLEELKPEAQTVSDLKVFDDSTWFKLLQAVRAKNTSIEAFLRAAKPFGIDEEGLVIGVNFRFHKEQLEAINNRRIIEDSLAEILGSTPKIKFVITERVDAKPSLVSNISSPSLTQAGQQDIIDAAKEIFGN